MQYIFIILTILFTAISTPSSSEILPDKFPETAQPLLEPTHFFQTRYRVLDKKIFHELSTLGISRHALSVAVFEKTRGSITWQQKVITAPLPADLSEKKVEDIFKKAITGFQPPVSHLFTIDCKSSAYVLSVFVGDILTHKLIFSSRYRPSQIERGIVAIVIDDLGYNYKPSLPLFDINLPITFSILPFYPFSKKIAEKAHQMGHETILHLPMESWDHTKNGIPSAENKMLRISMNDTELISQLNKSINAVPHIVGVSNHMGSRFTEDREKMAVIMKVLKADGLFFLDSRTTKKSVGFKMAKKAGVQTAKRDIFLDNRETYSSTIRQLNKLAKISIKKGRAIGIGHPYPSTIKALQNIQPVFKKMGVKVVPLSDLME